jgi:iron complex transport system ATP-binding protein
MELLRARAQAGDGVVAVLHDLTLAMRYCDRIILIDQGKIKIDGPPDLLTDDILAEVYSVDVLRGSYQGQPYILPWQTRGKA